MESISFDEWHSTAICDVYLLNLLNMRICDAVLLNLLNMLLVEFESTISCMQLVESAIS